LLTEMDAEDETDVEAFPGSNINEEKTDTETKEFALTPTTHNAFFPEPEYIPMSITIDVMKVYETWIKDIMGDFDLGIALDEAVLKEQFQRVRNVGKNDCLKRGYLSMTTLVTEEDVDFSKLSKRWKRANYLN
jgi:hypothetical protein